ncbi:hypothetical protein CIB84_006953, partial [Bambusicola thoracicus]
MGRYLSRSLNGLEFTPYQVQNPKKLTECFKKVCPDPGNMKELGLDALCWRLACAYQTPLSTILYPQKEEDASGSIPAPAAGPVAEPESQKEAEAACPHLAFSSSLKCLQKEFVASEEDDDPEVEFLKSLSTKQKQKLLSETSGSSSDSETDSRDKAAQKKTYSKKRKKDKFSEASSSDSEGKAKTQKEKLYEDLSSSH